MYKYYKGEYAVKKHETVRNKLFSSQSFLKMTALLCALLILSSCYVFPRAADHGAAEEAVSLEKFCMGDNGIYYSLDNGNNTASVLMAKEGAPSVTIPGTVAANGKTYTVTSVSSGAFSENVSLCEVILPETVTHIDSFAFFGCVSLENITAAGLASSGVDVFAGTPFITSEEFVVLGDVLFRYNGGSPLVKDIPEVSFVSDAFAWNSNVKTVILPEGVKAVGDGAFAFAENLRTVNLPFSLEKIGNEAFFGCVSLDEISLAVNVLEIGENAFSGTPYLSRLLDAPEDMIILGGGVLLRYKGDDSFVSVPSCVVSISDAFTAAPVSVVEIPENCVIGQGAFRNAYNLTRVCVKGDCAGIEAFAFDGCEKLSVLTFEGSFTGELDSAAFLGTSKSFTVYVKSGAAGFEEWRNTVSADKLSK
ncbi:MAG: leucine-rich repeat domain-containing protein [Ruminococcaceae bacterium]|nr:leucine-rich repeat domain-containing protein [Oscillospiraceae bacterium]